MPITPTDILKADILHNDGGLKVIAFWALFNDILTFPSIPADPSSYAASVTVADNFVMKQGKRFWKIQSTLEASGLDGNMVGERDGRSAENILTLQHPGSNSELLGWLEHNKNKDLVFIIQEINGLMRIIGADGLPASIESGEFKGGMKVADPKNIKFTIKSIGRYAPYYTGTVPLTPAV